MGEIMNQNNNKYGGNGKILIDKKNKIAIKTLKNNSNYESKKRFLKEIKVLSELQKKGFPNIVNVLSTNEDELKVEMELYDGDLNIVYDVSRGNVKKSIELLLPVVKALSMLSELSPPIYHRDLKPANILVRKYDDNYELVIADFGCAYFMNKEEPRETKEFRAVGAQQFRAPEYDYGRVENVTEKGDVFSLGKILWCLINGVNFEVFPYTLWFVKEYNLLERFEVDANMIAVNMIIAACVEIDIENRPTYTQLINMMENIVANEKTDYDMNLKKLRIQQFESERKVRQYQIEELTRSMLEIFYEDTMNSLNQISSDLGNMEILELIINEFSDSYKKRAHFIDYKVKKDAESYIFSTSFRNLYLSLNYHSASNNNVKDKDSDISSISCSYNIKSQSNQNNLQIYFKNRVLFSMYNGIEQIYNSSIFINFYSDMIDLYINSKA